MKLKRILVTGSAAAALVVGMAAPALAISVGGGTWHHGTDNGQVWSDYYHGSQCHSASVRNYWGTYERDEANAGYWAQASVSDTIFVDEAFWSTSC